MKPSKWLKWQLVMGGVAVIYGQVLQRGQRIQGHELVKVSNQ